MLRRAPNSVRWHRIDGKYLCDDNYVKNVRGPTCFSRGCMKMTC